MTTFHTELPRWTEGICGDGAAILRDGVMVPIEEVIARLNQAEAALTAPEQGPTDEDLIELFNWSDWNYISPETFIDIARTVLEGWGRPAVEPVPVAERLPGPEDCDAEGRCWWLDRPLKNGPAAWMLRRPDDGVLIPFIAWAPHWALPVPQEGSDG